MESRPAGYPTVMLDAAGRHGRGGREPEGPARLRSTVNRERVGTPGFGLRGIIRCGMLDAVGDM